MDFDFAPQMLHFVTETNCPQEDKNKRRKIPASIHGDGDKELSFKDEFPIDIHSS